MMAYPGQEIINQTSGSIYKFLETGKDTNGDRVTIQILLKEVGKVVPDHIHLVQDETFKVLKGQLSFIENGHKKILQVGEHIVLKSGVPHNHFNESTESVEYIQTIEPAYDIELFIVNYISMVNAGKIKNGDPSFLQKMVTLKYLDSPTLLAGVPIGTQKLMVNFFGPIARMLGYRAIYKKYTGIEK